MSRSVDPRAKQAPTADVIEEMFQSILATPKRQRRLRSSTFWDKFGFKHRTKDRVRQVRDILTSRGIVLNLGDGEFGKEDKDEWIILSFVEPAPSALLDGDGSSMVEVSTPLDSWFELLANRKFESEREVEYYLIVPLM